MTIEMIRSVSFKTSIVVATALALLLQETPAANSQVPPPIQVASISVLSTGSSPHIDFTFNVPITSYAQSTYRVTTLSGGVPSVLGPVLVSAAAQSPSTLSVPLNLQQMAANQDDSVSVSVTLGDSTNPAVFTTPSYFLDLSFLGTLKQYTSTVNSLQQANQSLTNTANACQTNLQNARRKVNPQSLNFNGVSLLGATQIILHLTTDVYATVQVTELQTNTVETDQGTDHYIRFTGLSPSTSYTFNAVALDATTGQPILSQSIPEKTAAQVVFAPVLTAISASGPTALVASIDFDPSHSMPSGFKSYLKFYYQEEEPDGTYGTKEPVGDGGLDANGIPTGIPYTAPYATPQAFTIPVPLANTNYLISYSAYDQYGDEYDYPGKVATTPAVTPALGFNGPIALTMNTNSGLTVSWSANRKIKTATLQIQFADGTYQPNIPAATTSSSESSVTIDLQGLLAILNKSGPPNSGSTAGSSKPPVFTISMDDGTGAADGKASISFSVLFTIASSTNATNSVQTAANKVSKSAQGKAKITWADVFNTGLGIVAKVI